MKLSHVYQAEYNKQIDKDKVFDIKYFKTIILLMVKKKEGSPTKSL